MLFKFCVAVICFLAVHQYIEASSLRHFTVATKQDDTVSTDFTDLLEELQNTLQLVEGTAEAYLKDFAEKYPEAYEIYKIISNAPLYLRCTAQTDSPTQDEACKDLCPLSQAICSSDVCTFLKDSSGVDCNLYVCTIACYESDRCPSQPQLMSAAKIEAMLDPVRETLNELKQKSAH